jgi:uncharacterized protein YheU (UPF0270 family)
VAGGPDPVRNVPGAGTDRKSFEANRSLTHQEAAARSTIEGGKSVLIWNEGEVTIGSLIKISKPQASSALVCELWFSYPERYEMMCFGMKIPGSGSVMKFAVSFQLADITDQSVGPWFGTLLATCRVEYECNGAAEPFMALHIVTADGENHGKADQKNQGLSDRNRDSEIRQTG